MIDFPICNFDSFGRFINNDLETAGTVIYHNRFTVAEIPVFAKRKKAAKGAGLVAQALMDYVVKKRPTVKLFVINADNNVIGFWQKMGFIIQKHPFLDDDYKDTSPMVRQIGRKGIKSSDSHGTPGHGNSRTSPTSYRSSQERRSADKAKKYSQKRGTPKTNLRR